MNATFFFNYTILLPAVCSLLGSSHFSSVPEKDLKKELLSWGFRFGSENGEGGFRAIAKYVKENNPSGSFSGSFKAICRTTASKRNKYASRNVDNGRKQTSFSTGKETERRNLA